MRDALLPLVLAVVIAAGVIFSLTARNPGHLSDPSIVATAPVDAPAATHTLQKNARSSTPRVSDPVHEDAVVEIVPQTETIAEEQAKTPKPISFDSTKLSEITPGMTESSVVEVLGVPALSAITMDRGGVQGTYVYSKRPRSDQFAVIRFADGKVTGLSMR
jgi:hypothetical protein